jgi:hypothetical protein
MTMARNGTNKARRAAKASKRSEAAQAEHSARTLEQYNQAVEDGVERLRAVQPLLTEGQARSAIQTALRSYYPNV